MPTYHVETDRGAFDVETDRDVDETELVGLLQERLVSAPTEGPSLTRRAAALGLRVGAPIVGAGLAGLAALPTGPGAVAAAAAGGAAGGAAGEAGAEYILGEEVDPLRVVAGAAVGAIPAGPFARLGAKAATVGAKAALGAAEGVTQGVLATGVQTGITQQRLPTLEEAGVAAAGGAVVGGAISGIAAKLGGAPAEKVAVPEREVSLPPAADAADDIVTATAKESGTFKRVPSERPLPATRPVREGRAAEADAFVDRTFADSSDEARETIKKVFADNPDIVETQVRGEVPFERTRAQAARLTFDPGDVTPGMNPNAEQTLAARNLVASLADKTTRLKADLDASPADAALGNQLTKAHEDLVDATIAVRGFRAEQGRALNALKIKAEAAAAPGKARFIEAANRYGATRDDIVAALGRAGDDPLRQYRELVNIARPDFRETIRGLYITNLLTNPKTFERNLVGNALRVVEDVALKPVAAGVDVLRSAATGAPRQVFAGESAVSAIAGVKSIPSAFRAAVQVLRQGYTDEAAHRFAFEDGKFDLPREFGGILRPLNVVGRALNATDIYFRTLAASMARDAGAYSRAVQKARSEGLSGARLRERTADLMAEIATNPPRDLLDEIESVSARSVFREGNQPARALDAWLETWPAPLRVAARIVVPFIRTPANIISQGFQHTPAGFVTKKGLEGGRTGAQEQARAAFGTLLIAPLVYLAANDQMTGSAPTEDAGKRDAFLAEHPENSVKIGDTWYQYSDLGPLAIPMSVVANSVYSWQTTGTEPGDSDVMAVSKKVFQAMVSTGQTVFDASYLSGLGELLDAAQNPNQSGAKFIQRRLSSFVPGQGLLRAAAQVESPVVRQPKTMSEAIQANIPGYQKGVLPRLDAFGQPVERGDVGLRALFIPTTKTPVDDPVRREMLRLDLEPEPAKSAKTVNVGGRVGQVALDRGGDFAIRQAKGLTMRFYVERAMASPVYQSASDETKKSIVERQMKRAGTFVGERARFHLRRGTPLVTENLVPPQVLGAAVTVPATEAPTVPAAAPTPKGPPTPLDPVFAEVSEAVGVDPTFLKAVAHTESRFNPAAISPQGAVGVMQILPSTFAGYADQAAQLLGRRPDIHNPRDNILVGALYYRDILGGTSDAAEAARLYHGGPNLKQHGPKTREYGQVVAAKFREWEAQ